MCVLCKSGESGDAVCRRCLLVITNEENTQNFDDLFFFISQLSESGLDYHENVQCIIQIFKSLQEACLRSIWHIPYDGFLREVETQFRRDYLRKVLEEEKKKNPESFKQGAARRLGVYRTYLAKLLTDLGLRKEIDDET